MKLLVITGAPGVIPFVVPATPPHVPLKFSEASISKVIVIVGIIPISGVNGLASSHLNFIYSSLASNAPAALSPVVSLVAFGEPFKVAAYPVVLGIIIVCNSSVSAPAFPTA